MSKTQRKQFEIVGKDGQSFACCKIVESYATEHLRVGDGGLLACELDGLAQMKPQNLSEGAIAELRKCRTQILIETSKALDLVIAMKARHTAPEHMQRQMTHQ